MIADLLQGAALGLSLAAPPGPVNALIAREASLHGPRAGLRAGLPAPIVDSFFLLVVSAGLAHAGPLDDVLPWLSGVGALLLGWLAWSTVRIRKTTPVPGPLAVWAVTVTNPSQYAWWLSAGAVFVAEMGAWGVAGFLVAIFGWVALFSHLVARGAARWDWFTPLLQVASADLLLAYALRLAAGAATGH